MHNGFIWITVDTTAPVLLPHLPDDLMTEAADDSSTTRNEDLLFRGNNLERADNTLMIRPDARPNTHIPSD